MTTAGWAGGSAGRPSQSFQGQSATALRGSEQQRGWSQWAGGGTPGPELTAHIGIRSCRGVRSVAFAPVPTLSGRQGGDPGQARWGSWCLPGRGGTALSPASCCSSTPRLLPPRWVLGPQFPWVTRGLCGVTHSQSSPGPGAEEWAAQDKTSCLEFSCPHEGTPLRASLPVALDLLGSTWVALAGTPGEVTQQTTKCPPCAAP